MGEAPGPLTARPRPTPPGATVATSAVFAVTYTYVQDPALLDEHRPDHRAFLRGLHEAGSLLLSGPLGGEPAGGLLILRGESAEEVLALLDQDPFRTVGAIAARAVRPWDVVIGELPGA